MSIAEATSVNSKNNTASDFEPCVVKDESLVAAVKRGHPDAFDELCKRHAQKMFRIARRIMRNREDAQDVVQECFLKAFLHLRSFDGRSRFSTWLTRIAMNAALMKLRKSRLSRESSLEQHEETMKFRPEVRVKDSSLNPEDRYAESEREAILNNAIAALRPTIRRALEIYKLEECSVRETAEALGISVPAAKGRLFHARSELRKSPQLQFVVPSHWSQSRARAHAAR